MFLDVGRQRPCLAVQTVQRSPGAERKRQRQKGKSGFKRTGRAFLGEDKHRILNGGQKKTLLGGPKERKARKTSHFQKAMKASREVLFALTNQTKAQAKTSSSIEVEETTKKERARKAIILNLDFQPRKHPVKKEMSIAGIRRLVFQPLA